MPVEMRFYAGLGFAINIWGIWQETIQVACVLLFFIFLHFLYLERCDSGQGFFSHNGTPTNTLLHPVKYFAGEAGGGFTSADVWPTGSNDSLDASASLPQSPPPALTHCRLLHRCPFHCEQPKFWASLAHHIMLLIKMLAFFSPFYSFNGHLKKKKE